LDLCDSLGAGILYFLVYVHFWQRLPLEELLQATRWHVYVAILKKQLVNHQLYKSMAGPLKSGYTKVWLAH